MGPLEALEKKGAAETTGERRTTLQAIGLGVKLVERKVSTYKNGRDLTAIYRGKMPKNNVYILNGGL